MSIQFVEIPWRERTVRIEHEFLSPAQRVEAGAPLIVFLHEGLGSRSMWRDFPQRLCDAVGAPGLVYSRPGYGRSTPRAADEHWGLDFMHRQADEVLPALLDALDVPRPVWLFGHSDGGSIALLHAAHQPQRVAGAVVLAPHIRVEAFGLASIRAARVAYETTELRSRLSRHHDDVDSAFWGWNDIWLHPDFPTWNIEAELPAIACPLLAVQGLDDPYGTLEQIRGIARARPSTTRAPTELLELPACGHDPQRDQPDALIAAVQAFMARHR
ncbi:alpha/beta fold hydrolase [Sphaerotilus mobilis]|uniref:Pimeloyl-ACP methyl ester carboxylesterase n=1 Tax=Sphaerotilus mobilis TaxID=47994 RepID=A0A4Q7LGU1_9BURK|nr:alpha/beta hydrolase [Sphaerotilus mobilis]RZS53271.1 pimeloyl-ACP methyl ester carboxylesterase [Sphaerotilus mobilis]